MRKIILKPRLLKSRQLQFNYFVPLIGRTDLSAYGSMCFSFFMMILTSASSASAWCVRSCLCACRTTGQGAWREGHTYLQHKHNAFIKANVHLNAMMTQRHTYKNMPGLCGGLLRFLDMTVERWTKAASTMALPSVLISCSSWHRIHVTTCLLSLPPARHRRGPTQTSVVSHELGL